MKIRQGFVSNSSSSSFAIIGTRIEFEEITDEKIQNNDSFYVRVSEFDNEGSCFVFVNDVNTLHLLQEYDDLKTQDYGVGECYEIIAAADDNLSTIVFPKNKVTKVYPVNKDNYSPSNFAETIEMIERNENYKDLCEKFKEQL